jgi:hypothetical protein
MGWIEDETMRLLCPYLSDVFVGRIIEDLEATSNVVGGEEVGEVKRQLIVNFIVVALHRRLLEDAIHSVDLPVRRRMMRLSQRMQCCCKRDRTDDRSTSLRALSGSWAVGEPDADASKHCVWTL